MSKTNNMDAVRTMASGKAWDIVSRRFEEVMDLFDKPIGKEVPLEEQLTLAKSWDNPWALAAAVDSHPIWQARWNVLLRNHKVKLGKIQTAYNRFIAMVQDLGERTIVNVNLNQRKLTANKAQPTNAQVERWVLLKILCEPDTKSAYHKYQVKHQELKTKLETIQTEVDYLQIVVQAFKTRGELLGFSVSLLRTMMDKDLVGQPISVSSDGRIKTFGKLPKQP